MMYHGVSNWKFQLAGTKLVQRKDYPSPKSSGPIVSMGSMCGIILGDADRHVGRDAEYRYGTSLAVL